ncbi:hypothetical protein ACIPD2_14320 [Streptomyces griseofuscus]|uniref:hypothetical protein n=1 Tax=Streptomyces griseofuscus TaxID=146922 RepID=UPI0037F15834
MDGLHDADVLAGAVIQQVEKNGTSLLDGCSETCLSHTWERQASAMWRTQVMHDSGDATYEREFRKQIVRKDLETMLEPPTTSPSASL